MRSRQLEDVRALLRRERHIMHYYKDRYAAMLLSWAFGACGRIAQIKKTRFAGLLEKPAIKAELASNGAGVLYPLMLDAHMPRETDVTYRLTFGQWPFAEDRGDRFWNQVSRPGYSLVVQLNFTGSHDEVFEREVGEGRTYCLNHYGHPVHETGRITLAWARVDLDLKRGEALIEELQTDWLREAHRIYRQALSCDQEDRGNMAVLAEWTDRPVTAAAFCRYYDQALLPHAKIWHEALLAATLGVLIDVLGIRRIWMHGFETGNRLKRLDKQGRQPPASLYTELPRRFCFDRIPEAPGFLLAGVSKKTRAWLNSGKGQFWHHAF